LSESGNPPHEASGPVFEKPAPQDHGARAFRLGMRRGKIAAGLAGSGENYSQLNDLGSFLPATHDEDLGRKTHDTVRKIGT